MTEELDILQVQSLDSTTVYIYFNYGYNISSIIPSILILHKVVTRKQESIFLFKFH